VLQKVDNDIFRLYISWLHTGTYRDRNKAGVHAPIVLTKRSGARTAKLKAIAEMFSTNVDEWIVGEKLECPAAHNLAIERMSHRVHCQDFTINPSMYTVIRRRTGAESSLRLFTDDIIMRYWGDATYSYFEAWSSQTNCAKFFDDQRDFLE
jgi:hypothetical protein